MSGGGSDFHSHGSGDITRPLYFRDSSRNLEDGEKGELGNFRQLVVGVVNTYDKETGESEDVQAFLQPRNWHLSDSGQPIDDAFPSAKDRRLSVALIADHENDFPGWKLTDAKDPSPFLDDWEFDQKGTRIVDYHDKGGKGNTALFSQLVKVVDDHFQQYTPALLLNRKTGNHEQAASGYVWDENLDQSGLLDTVFILDPADVYGKGRDGTPWGILGIRTDAHFEFTFGDPPDGAGDSSHHGGILFDITDISKFAEPSVGAPYKSTLAWDPSVANADSGLGREAGKWRPWYRIPPIMNQNPPYDGPVPYPGDPNLPPGGPNPVTDGGMVVIPVGTTGTAVPPDPTGFGSILISQVNGYNEINVSQPNGTWGLPNANTTNGLNNGPLSSQPAAPTAAGNVYVGTDKMNAPGGGTGNTDPTNFFNIGINDALMWGKVALCNFDQTISGWWTFSGQPVVTGTLAYSGSGKINANQILGQTVSIFGIPATGKALIYDGTNWGQSILGVSGGGTGLNATPTANGILWSSDGSTYTTLSAGTSADGTGGKTLQLNATATALVFQQGLNAGQRSGTDLSGTSLNITGMKSTGLGTGGGISFGVTPPGGLSGTTVNTVKSAMFIDGKQNVVIRADGSALSTSATDGFLHIPMTGGTPTGAPTTYAGSGPLVWDSTGLALWVFSGVAWHQVGGGASHALLDGAIDSDTTAGTVARGDIITGQGVSPTWTRLALAVSGNYLRSNGTDAVWATIPAADVPNLDASKITTGLLAVARGGTGLGTFTLGDTLYASAANTLSALAGNTTTARKFLRQTGTGTVSAAPAWDTLLAADIPNLDASKITTGLLAVARGGTGVDGSAAANGALLIGNGSGYTLATITAGSGISVTNAAGSITIAASGSTGSFDDSTFNVFNHADNTKKIALDVSTITTGTTRTYSVANYSGTLDVNPAAASGTNIAGTNHTIWGGQSTGIGAGGSLVFQVSPAGASGSSVNSLATALTIDSTSLATFAGAATVNGKFVVGVGGPYSTASTVYAAPSVSGDAQSVAAFYGNVSSAQDNGSSISLGGFTNGGGGLSNFAEIGGYKENGTAADTAGYIAFMTHANGGTALQRWRIVSAGHLYGRSDAAIGWTNGAAATSADTGISRLASGSIGFGNGLQGSTSATCTMTTLNLAGTSNQLVMQSAGITGTVTWTPSTSNKTITLPNLTGTAMLIDGGQTVSSAVWNGTIVGVAYGGTGLNGSAAANGKLLIGNGTGYTLANLTPGSHVTITNAAGSITVESNSPKGYINGLLPSWGSATTIAVAAGLARDDADATDMVFAGGTIDITANGVILGVDRKALSGTVATSTLNATVTGTGTAFLTEFGTRALSVGTIGTGGVSSTTITGASTTFTKDVAVGDLIGNATVGYARVTAIASDTSLTVVSALTITNGSTGNVIENCTFQATGATAQKVNAIASNTSLTTAANSSATTSGAVGFAGARVASTFLNVWAIAGASGVSVYASTQRTTLLAPPSGYTTSKRRIVALAMDSSSNLLKFYASHANSASIFVLYDDMNSQPVLSAGTATSFSAVDVSAFVPPTAAQQWLLVLDLAGAGSVANVEVRSRGSSASIGEILVQVGASNQALGMQGFVANFGQAFEYKLSGSGSTSGAYVDVVGFVENR